MNSKERFLAALSNRQPDRVPIYEALIDEPIVNALVESLGLETHVEQTSQKLIWGQEGYQALDRYCWLVDELGLDATSYSFSTDLQPIGGSYARDKYERMFRLSEFGEPAIVEGPIQGTSDLKGYDMASRLSIDDFSRMRYILERVGPEKAHFVDLNDPFKVCWLLRGGMEPFFIDLIFNPELVQGLVRIATDFALATVDMAAQIGVDGLLMDGDYAGEKHLLISAQHYREYLKPYHKEIVDYVHRRGLKIIKHTDGNVWPILDDFIEVGFDAFHPIQPQCMDIVAVKEHVGGRMCLIGNIDCRDLLCFDTPENVEKTVQETIEKAAPGGGYIISSSNSIHVGVKPDNYLAMLRAAHRYGVYPVGVH